MTLKNIPRGPIQRTPLGHLLCWARIACGATLLDMARHLEMLPSTLQAIEIGKEEKPEDFEERAASFFRWRSMAKRGSFGTWHPWPQEKPLKDGRYLLSVRIGLLGICAFKDGEWHGCPPDQAVAWMELPPVYVPKEEIE